MALVRWRDEPWGRGEAREKYWMRKRRRTKKAAGTRKNENAAFLDYIQTKLSSSALLAV